MVAEGAADHRVAAHALQADLGEGRPPRDPLQQLQDGRHHWHEVNKCNAVSMVYIGQDQNSWMWQCVCW